MNYLAFENEQQWAEVLNDDTFVKYGAKKWPTVANETMIKYARHTWEPDAPYVILLNMYKSKHEKENQWVRGFKGKRLCVIDGEDKARYWEPFIDVADIYIKENSYRSTDRQNVRIGCYCPSMKVPFLIKKHKIRWRNERKLEWFFAGDGHKGRDKHVAHFATRHKHGKHGDEHMYGRPDYLNTMSKAKLAPSWKGYGDRCRREWEALLAGAMLVQDPRLKDYPFVIMRPEEHFSFRPEWNERIALAGYDLARTCWMQSPSIDIRMAALYLFHDVAQLNTVNQVFTAERIEEWR